MEHVPPSVQGTTTFSFRRRWAQIDWRSLASIDIDRIAQEMDVKTLQQNIMNVTFCNVLSEEFHNVDPNFMKLFRLAQLIIEYLLFTQQYLSEQLTKDKERDMEIDKKLTEMTAELETKQKELVLVKKENRKRRKIIEKYQQMLNAGAMGLHSCPVCRREFISDEYLKGHITRRHPNHVTMLPMAAPKVIDSAPTPVPLVLPPSAPPPDPTPPPPLIDREQIKAQILEQLNERLLQSEAHIKESLSAKFELQAIEQKLNDLTQEKAQEQERAKLELEEYRSSILNELHQQRQETERLQETLQSAQDELTTIKKEKAKRVTHLGHLEGAEEIDLTGKKAQEEVTKIRSTMQAELDKMKEKLKKQKVLMKERFQSLTEAHQRQLSEYTERMKSLEETCLSCFNNSDKTFKENFHDLQQKLKEQEHLISGYEKDLHELKSTHTSPVIQVPEVPLVQTHHLHHDVETMTQDNEEIISTEVSFTEEEDESSDGNKLFTPFKDKPYITCQFDHAASVTEKMRHAMGGLVDKSMKKRGLHEGTIGLSEDELTRKYRELEEERNTKEKSHYDFKQHREIVVQQVNEIMDQHYAPPEVTVEQIQMVKGRNAIPTNQLRTPLTTPTASPKLQRTVNGHGASPARITVTASTPPTTSTMKSTDHHVKVSGGASLVTPNATPTKGIIKQTHGNTGSLTSSPATKKKPPVPVKGSREQLLTNDTSSSLTDLSSSISSEQASPVVGATRMSSQPTSNQPAAKGNNKTVKIVSITDSKKNVPVATSHTDDKEEEDSPWDSDDSDDEQENNGNNNAVTTATNTANSKPMYSSTPIKEKANSTGLDPAKRPPGGVPVMIMTDTLSNDNESDVSDTFTLSDKPPPPLRPKEVNLMDIPTISNELINDVPSKKSSVRVVVPHSGSSKSALTTITNTINDDFDSDLSELDLMT